MYRRNVAPVVLDALSDTPVVFVRGARQVGKTTLVKMIADTSKNYSYVSLDHLGQLSIARTDPIGFIRGLSKPAIIDEIQRVPDLVLAIKEEVDRNRFPGSFLITGSSDVFAFPMVSESLRGRIESLTLWPLAESEICGSKKDFVSWLFDDMNRSCQKVEFKESELVGRIARGGFPEALVRKTAARRDTWFASYIETMLYRDVRDIARITDVGNLHLLLKLLVPRVAQIFNQSEVAREAKIPNSSLSRYISLLENLFTIHFLPAFSSNLTSRAFKSPKVYFCDTGIACHLLGLDESGLAQNPTLMGHVFENFVVNEVMKQLSWSKEQVRPFHFRSHGGTEVDLVLEDRKGRICGIEIKWSHTCQAKDAKGLRQLKAKCKDKWIRGVIFYGGTEILAIDENIHALPIEFLWNKK